MIWFTTILVAALHSHALVQSPDDGLQMCMSSFLAVYDRCAFYNEEAACVRPAPLPAKNCPESALSVWAGSPIQTPLLIAMMALSSVEDAPDPIEDEHHAIIVHSVTVPVMPPPSKCFQTFFPAMSPLSASF